MVRCDDRELSANRVVCVTRTMASSKAACDGKRWATSRLATHDLSSSSRSGVLTRRPDEEEALGGTTGVPTPRRLAVGFCAPRD